MNASGDTSGAVPIHHLALPAEWAAAQQAGRYAMSTRGRTLADEGFVHAATRHQVEGVANRYYADLDHLIVVTIDPARLDVEVRWESAIDGPDELFPHVYGPIPLSAVTTTADWRRPGTDTPWILSDR